VPNYLLTASGLVSGSQSWNIRAYAVSASTESVVATTWDTAFQAYWNTAGVLSGMPTTTSLTQTAAATLTSNFRQQSKTKTTHAIAGTSASVGLPDQVCFLATLRTAMVGKASHGRWYLPAPAVSGIAATGNLWIAAWMTAATTGLTALGTALGSGITLQVYHSHATKGGLAAQSLTPCIPQCDATNKPAIQRLRGNKVVGTRSSWTL